MHADTFFVQVDMIYLAQTEKITVAKFCLRLGYIYLWYIFLHVNDLLGCHNTTACKDRHRKLLLYKGEVSLPPVLSAYIDSRGIAPTFGLLKELGGWPVLGDKNGGSWNESDYDLTTLLLNLLKYNNKPLINLYVYTDSKNSTTRIIYVSDLHYFVSFL